jgi:hypothetical protein
MLAASIVRRQTRRAAATLLAVACAGCGTPVGSESVPTANSDPQKTAVGSPQPTADKDVQSSHDSPKPAANDAAKPLVRTDEQGRKWLGNVPYDVWFDDPLATAGDLSEPATATPAVPAVSPPNDPSTAAVPPQPATGTTSQPMAQGPEATTLEWGRIVPIGLVDAETKSIRNRLDQNMRTVGTYNGTYKEIQGDGATLAALAEIAVEHPASIAWKDRAPQVRDLSAQVVEAATAIGREAYDATQKPYEQLISVLDGGRAGNAPAAATKADFAERANRAALMHRLNRSFNWLKQNVGKANDLTAKADDAGHETSMMAAIAAVISHNSYDLADEENYRTQATDMIEAALEARKSIDTMNFSAFQESFNRVQQRCDKCHAEYRFGNE